MKPRSSGVAASGPLAPVACVRCFVLSPRRGRRYPARAQGLAVFASLRLRCGAQSEVAPRNSLRSLRSLRSNRRGESVDEARCARRPQTCAPRRRTLRPHRVPPAARHRIALRNENPRPPGKGAPGQVAARLRGAEERRVCGRARSALRDLTRCVCSTAASAGSYATGPQTRAPQGSRCTHRPPRRSAAACPGATLLRRTKRAKKRTARVPQGPQAAPRCSASRVAVRDVRGGAIDMNSQHGVTGPGRAPGRGEPARTPPGLAAACAWVEGLS